VLALLDAGRTTGAVVVPVKIGYVKVGTHHRVPAQAVLEFQRARAVRREQAAEALASFSNEIGLVD
jgi:hypothetical protein